jgi:hypothetical protein
VKATNGSRTQYDKDVRRRGQGEAFPGLVLPSGQELTLGLLATIIVEVAPFRAYAPFPALLQFFVVFSKSVQHHLRIWLDHLNCVKMATFQFYLQFGKQRKVGWVGDDSHVAFGKKFPGEKVSERRCVVVMQQPVLLSPKFGSKSSHIFTRLQIKRRKQSAHPPS